eukprot:1153866-Pelagomonas_calceolata.AAC.1
MTLEDSKLFKRAIYASIVEFTSAFYTTDHDKLLCTTLASTQTLLTMFKIYTGRRTQGFAFPQATSQRHPYREGYHPGRHLVPLPVTRLH